ncbi:MAG: hypothetical protein K6356_03765 [Chloroflexus sp.]
MNERPLGAGQPKIRSIAGTGRQGLVSIRLIQPWRYDLPAIELLQQADPATVAAHYTSHALAVRAATPLLAAWDVHTSMPSFSV